VYTSLAPRPIRTGGGAWAGLTFHRTNLTAQWAETGPDRSSDDADPVLFRYPLEHWLITWVVLYPAKWKLAHEKRQCQDHLKIGPPIPLWTSVSMRLVLVKSVDSHARTCSSPREKLWSYLFKPRCRDSTLDTGKWSGWCACLSAVINKYLGTTTPLTLLSGASISCR